MRSAQVTILAVILQDISLMSSMFVVTHAPALRGQR
jgi:hypothetical protein